MTLDFDTVVSAFLQKVTEFQFLSIEESDRQELVDGYLRRAVVEFQTVCKYDLRHQDRQARKFTDDFADEDVDEIVEILSEGMIVQWLKQYLYSQEILENVMNTADFSTYSSAELLHRVSGAYNDALKEFRTMICNYSFRHGNIRELHYG